MSAIDVLGKKKMTGTFSHLSSRKAKQLLLKTLDDFPYPVRVVQTDNGAEFLGELDRLLKELNVPHYFTYPNCPKQNSVVERSIQTDVKEFYEQCNFAAEIGEQNRPLKKWDDTYNNFRSHRSLACPPLALLAGGNRR